MGHITRIMPTATVCFFCILTLLCCVHQFYCVWLVSCLFLSSVPFALCSPLAPSASQDLVKIAALRLTASVAPVQPTLKTSAPQWSTPPLTHSLTAALDQLRVVASSTSNDPGPRSRQHQQIGQRLLPLAAVEQNCPFR